MNLVLLGNDFAIDFIKLKMASLFESKQEELRSYEPPKRQESQTEEEYQKAYKDFMLEQIEYITNLKHLNFASYLEKYNAFLSAKREAIEVFDRNKQKELEEIQKKLTQKKVNFWTSALLSLVFPQGIITFAVLGVGRNIIYNRTIKSDTEDIVKIEIAKEALEKTHTGIYDLCCDLRADYHKSKKECEELKKRALAGEDIIEDLVKMMSPERISLQSPKKMQQEMEEKEKQKVLVYQKKSNE